MKALIVVMMLGASQLTPPPLLPAPQLFPEPVEEAVPIQATWWFWPTMGLATVQTAVTIGVLVFFVNLFTAPPRPGSNF